MAWCLVKHRDNFTFTFYMNCKANKWRPLWFAGRLICTTTLQRRIEG